jgi:hypothetical protein
MSANTDLFSIIKGFRYCNPYKKVGPNFDEIGLRDWKEDLGKAFILKTNELINSFASYANPRFYQNVLCLLDFVT